MLQFKLTYIFCNSPIFTYIYNTHVKFGKFIVLMNFHALNMKDKFPGIISSSHIIKSTEVLFDIHSIIGMFIMQAWRTIHPIVPEKERKDIYVLCQKWMDIYGIVNVLEVEYAIFHKLSFIGNRKVKQVLHEYLTDLSAGELQYQ